MPSKPPAPSESANYRAWKARAAALLERQGLPLGVMRERDWRQLYIRGKAPEDAAQEAETLYWRHGRPGAVAAVGRVVPFPASRRCGSEMKGARPI
jgi:hypothetical protein